MSFQDLYFLQFMMLCLIAEVCFVSVLCCILMLIQKHWIEELIAKSMTFNILTECAHTIAFHCNTQELL